ncbi:hypothetical protein C5F47_05240 [Nitrosopumilus cobalaminigenes]|uniref:Uncharacterized protein n=1 Tax=Nitrosopumilus cobalaminigenes TaxID=1470066 RepID=A0A7D5M0X4_9ARCH|nr:hypothetical protein [Nitrosopumilus cobalaminigenes]QLH02995.1 hypothetical protein C5F47_05240 [Nitrosopumilus cobalaminigenes]
MGFKKRRNNRHNNYNRKKGGARPKLAVIGAISLVIGILLIHYVGVPELRADRMSDNPALIAGFVGVVGGVLMLLLSLSKRNQVRVGNVIDSAREAFRDDCMCCKCQNCDRNHNHWTHD